MILSFGCGAPFSYLWKKLGKGASIESSDLRKGSVKAFRTRHDNRDLMVIGFPHPSRFAIQKKFRGGFVDP
jgi:hypothetical protein